MRGRNKETRGGETYRRAEPLGTEKVSADFVRALEKVGADRRVIDAAKRNGVDRRTSR
jgi:hypothetical protein